MFSLHGGESNQHGSSATRLLAAYPRPYPRPYPPYPPYPDHGEGIQVLKYEMTQKYEVRREPHLKTQKNSRNPPREL